MKKISLLLLLLFCVSLNYSFAQFEGKITFYSYEVESGEKVKDDDAATLYITADRILLQGDESYKVGGSLKTEGILIRHKEEDFVFLTGEKQAMKISKAGITSFMNMFGDDAKDEMNKAETNIRVEETGETKQVNGYNCEKFIFTDKEKPEVRSEVWMTQELDINWGMLAEPWGDNMKGFMSSELPFDLIFNDGYFPILWEQYENGDLSEIVEVEVSTTDVARSMVEISPDVKVVSLQDYLFEQMREQQ